MIFIFTRETFFCKIDLFIFKRLYEIGGGLNSKNEIVRERRVKCLKSKN